MRSDMQRPPRLDDGRSSDEDTPLLAAPRYSSMAVSAVADAAAASSPPPPPPPSASSCSSDGGKVSISVTDRLCTFEPILVLLCFGLSVSGVVLADQIIYQSCVVTLGYDRALCAQLGTRSNSSDVAQLETIVQPYAAKITMVNTILMSVLPALCALFMGPWSDKYGRKPAMIVPAVGFITTYVMIGILSLLSKRFLVDPWCYVVAHIPAAILGGSTVLMAAIFSYLTDTTSEANRTVRIGILQACTMLGAFVGLLSSSFILQWTNVPTMFFLSAGTVSASCAFLYFCLEDSIKPDASMVHRQVREIFRLSHLAELLTTFFKKRSFYDRGIVWLTISIGIVTVLGAGGGTVFFLYTRRQFGWTIQEFTIWQAVELLSIVAGNVIGISVLKTLLKLPDIWLALLSVLNYALDALIKGLARQGWELFLATGITPLKATEGAALMAICSAIIPSSEIAKFYSIAMAMTNTVSLASAPLFTYIYNSTVATSPQVFNFVSSGIFSLNVVLVGVIAVLLRKRRKAQADPLFTQDSEILT
ncbi:proton-coupled folate transporter-like [Anopheles merus]|uniref:Major facilitator superfamily (MFS) profile domain-containing protein n=1 Tax=Anopheles merus TaxID=30066 RepID=A0A182VJA0_ANOME|nr:proton-coupled folate transporter-like [Anopheles merus]